MNYGRFKKKLILSLTIGLDDIRAEINMDHRDTPINKLCISENGKVKFLSMLTALPLDEISEQFGILFRAYSTKLVNKIWKSHMRAAIDAASPLVISDIKIKIWHSTFQECKCLLDSVHDRSIRLADVDRHFKECENREQLLHRLHNDMRKCLGDAGHSKKLDWIKTAVHFMKQYWSLLRLGDAAKTVMFLKTELNLSGDFTLIQSIAEEVCKAYTVKTRV